MRTLILLLICMISGCATADTKVKWQVREGYASTKSEASILPDHARCAQRYGFGNLQYKYCMYNSGYELAYVSEGAN